MKYPSLSLLSFVAVALGTSTAAQAETAIALNFVPPNLTASTDQSPAVQPEMPAEDAPAQPQPTPVMAEDATLFAGGSESIVARTVGAAEGTRTPDGGKTSLWEGHVDPGNGVWNRGTFSYQFGNAENLSPEESDRRQLAKIKGHYEATIVPQAEALGLDLNLLETINGIDLANQAPLAVTESGGYVERLAAAKRDKKLEGHDAILEARVWAYWDDRKGGWDAPGLRAYDDISKEESIRRDQQRRMDMIDQALAAYQAEHPEAIAAQPPEVKPSASTVPTASPSPPIEAEKMADRIIFQDLSRPSPHSQTYARAEQPTMRM